MPPADGEEGKEFLLYLYTAMIQAACCSWYMYMYIHVAQLEIWSYMYTDEVMYYTIHVAYCATTGYVRVVSSAEWQHFLSLMTCYR